MSLKEVLTIMSGFKKFIMQGNVVDLAVGIVIGVAFGEVIGAFIGGVIDPIVALILGNNPDGLNGIGVDVGEQFINLGVVISALITFIATAAAIYFLVVTPLNKLNERRKAGVTEEVEPTNEEKMVALLEQIASR